MIKVVLDTNVFISGIFWSGNYCSQIIDLWKSEKIQLITSLEIVQELVETLLEFKIQLSEERILAWEKEILAKSYIVKPNEKFKIIEDDPADNKFLDAAAAGLADYIISQDLHFLKIKQLGNIIILSLKSSLLKSSNSLSFANGSNQ